MAQTGKIRMMIVDDSAETREYLRKLLQFEGNIDLVGMAANGRDAVQLARETRPHLILMDINMPVMDGISAAEIIFHELPAVRVVMMSVQSEMAYLRRAMQVGAREFLIKPFTHDELLNILGEVGRLEPTPGEAARAVAREGAAAPARQARLATVAAVFSPRGGSGCSTVALNLAIALQGQRKARTLLVDGNLRFGALDAMLNLQITRSIADVLPSLSDDDPELVNLSSLPHTSGIHLLAAPPSPEMADLLSAQNLEQILKLARRGFDYVVVDVGTRLDDRALFFLDAADHIFVLLTPDIPAIKNVRLFLEVAASLEYDLEKITLVLNRADPRGGITASAIERHLKHPILTSIPESTRVVQGAINRGVPLVLFERQVDKTIPVTRQLLTLIDKIPEPGTVTSRRGKTADDDAELDQEPGAPSTPQPKKKGLLGGLFSRGD